MRALDTDPMMFHLVVQVQGLGIVWGWVLFPPNMQAIVLVQ